MTALAILGSAISTSLMSRGRSITTDLPTPSGMKREFRSLPTTSMPLAPVAGALTLPGRGSPAGGGSIATIPNVAINAASEVVRISVALVMLRSLVGTFSVGADSALPLLGRPDLWSKNAGLRFDTDRTGRAVPMPIRRVSAQAVPSRPAAAPAQAQA